MKHYEVNIHSKYRESSDELYTDTIHVPDNCSVSDVCEQFCRNLRTFIREMHNCDEISREECITQLSLASAIEKLFESGVYSVIECEDYTEIFMEL